MRMLQDIGHPFASGEPVYDVTFENVQAGLRTDYLFRLANQRRAFVLGTGDLSELALGWCTYGVGDQMSHYNVNGVRREEPDPVPRALGRELGTVRRRGFGHAAVDRGHGDLARARAGERLGGDPEHGAEGRPVRAAGFPPLLHHALRPAAVEGGIPRVARMARRGARRVAARLPRRSQARLRPRDDQEMARACSCIASSRSASSSARRCPTGRRWCREATFRHAATGARRRTAMRGCGWTSSSATFLLLRAAMSRADASGAPVTQSNYSE